MQVEGLDSDARDVAATIVARKRALALKMSRHRNQILSVGLCLQLITVMFGFCSMVSGWFGMNLDNGICGPDGCNDFSTLTYQGCVATQALNNVTDPLDVLAACGPPFGVSDHGNQMFLIVVLCSTGAVLIAGVVAWYYILHLF